MKYSILLALAIPLYGFADAGVVFEIDDVMIPYSDFDQLATFEVYILSSESPQPNISAHQLRLTLPVDAGIVFENARVPVDRTYLGPSAEPSVAISAAGLRLDSGDFAAVGSVPLFDGAGLLRFDVKVPGGTVEGDYRIMLDASSTRTFLSDVNNDFVSRTLGASPTLTVTSIPEPSQIIYAAVCGAFLIGLRSRNCKLGLRLD